ncbi:hypothetical protein MSPP1_001923 [Malassezia sp. CBS 17886]|nr:hypothetical protein MSPP1_001923 [Malassezia sp. CBS 17886]
MSRKLTRRELRAQAELEELEALGGPKEAASTGEDKSAASGEAHSPPLREGRDGGGSLAGGFAALELVSGGSGEEGGGEGAGAGQGKSEGGRRGGAGGGGENEGAVMSAEESVSGTDKAPAARASAAKKKKNKKKNKKKAGGDPPEEGAAAAGGARAVASTKNKKKTPDAKSKSVNELTLEEMDALLATEPGEAADAAAPAAMLLRSALALESQHLDPAVELRRQFGAAAIKAMEREKGPQTRATARHRGAASNSNLRARTLLSTPKATWPDLARTFVGLTMTTSETSTGRVCSWEHSRAYRQTQFQFAQAVRSYDINALVALLRVFPWHIDTLLQLADASRHQGDLGQAADFIDRALFALERSASPPFVAGLTASAGPPSVDFARAENRALWLAAHRNVDLFGRRGTWRTSLEWCKLIFGLDLRDPHGILLWIDFLALKTRQHAWLLRFLDALEAQRAAEVESGGHVDNVRARTAVDGDKAAAAEPWRGALDWSVGANFARALALRALEKEAAPQGDSRAALRLAVARHPVAAAMLCEKLDIALPAEAQASAQFAQSGAWTPRNGAFRELLAHIYVHRSLSLWKEAGVAAWLKDAVDAAVPAVVQSPSCGGVADGDTQMGVFRHVFVADLPEALSQQLRRYLPPDVRDPPGGVLAYDPLPPAGGTHFDDAYYGSMQPVGSVGQPAGEPPRALMDILRHLQTLDPTELETLLANVDDETRAELVGALGGGGEMWDGGGLEVGDEGERGTGDGEERGSEEGEVTGSEDGAGTGAVDTGESAPSLERDPTPDASQPAPSLWSRAMRTLWG